MKTLGAIEEVVKKMWQHQAEVTRLQGELDATIARITADGTRHPGYIKEKVTEARSKATPAIYETLGKMNAIHQELVKDERFWQDKRFLLSTKPLTEPLNAHPGAPAKDAGVEAMSRIAKMTEFSKLDAEQLHLAAENAKREGRFAELHLLTLENNSRDQRQPGWQAIDLADVVLDDQEQALRLFGEARKMSNGISLAMKTAEGKTASPIDKINAERGNPAPFAGPQPAGNPQDRINAAREVR
jgi:hypothetical protein